MNQSPPCSFELLHVDRATGARRGRLHTPHGTVETPAFMPVGTQGSVKGIEVEQLHATGSQMILANTYHLAMRPGADVVAQLGGLHAFSGWNGPILTDSGGFQIFSLAQQVRIDEEQAIFQSHVDGREFALSPERSVALQGELGSDIAMVLDDVVALPNEAHRVREACERSVRWASRCLAAHRRPDQALFAIVQGGLDPMLRARCAEELSELPFAGFAIGGLSVGETAAERDSILDVTCPRLPEHRPRYLMGVGRPADLLAGIRRGVDLFDCVLPTRNGRNALAFVPDGTLKLRNQAHRTDGRPLEEGCPCAACRRSRGYLRHLFLAGEMLGPSLLSIHNLTYFQRLMQGARDAIERDAFDAFQRERVEGRVPGG